jgi:transcriptional regulator with XRE-family HTH domain
MKFAAKDWPPPTFGQRLRTAREDRELTQAGLAESLGLPPSAVSHWEGGRREPSLKNLRRLIDVMDLRSDELYELLGFLYESR